MNSGTDQAAVLDFTLPRGENGTSPSPDLLMAYSTPAQPGTNGSGIIFDRNGTACGSSVSHLQNSSQITVSQPGVYTVDFHTVMAPQKASSYPVTLSAYLTQSGNTVQGASSQHTFQSSSESSNLSFSVPVAVTAAPAVFEVIGDGGDYLYSSSTISVYRLGDIPEESEKA